MVTTSRPFSLRVNGTAHVIAVPEGTPLLYVLRETLGLKGTRFGCGQGTCGACTVIMDGRAVMSCDLAVETAADREIETVESLRGADGALHPLATAALDAQAAQCGYCLPGILMAAKALLDGEPDPPEARIRAVLDDNLCRCGAHLRILRAVKAAAVALRQEGEA